MQKRATGRLHIETPTSPALWTDSSLGLPPRASNLRLPAAPQRQGRSPLLSTAYCLDRPQPFGPRSAIKRTIRTKLKITALISTAHACAVVHLTTPFTRLRTSMGLRISFHEPSTGTRSLPTRISISARDHMAWFTRISALPELAKIQ